MKTMFLGCSEIDWDWRWYWKSLAFYLSDRPEFLQRHITETYQVHSCLLQLLFVVAAHPIFPGACIGLVIENDKQIVSAALLSKDGMHFIMDEGEGVMRLRYWCCLDRQRWLALDSAWQALRVCGMPVAKRLVFLRHAHHLRKMMRRIQRHHDQVLLSSSRLACNDGAYLDYA